MRFKNANVVVTGGLGFIGSNLAEQLLREGANVTIVDDNSTGRLANIAPFAHDLSALFIESITNLELLSEVFSGVDYVFHQAAIPSVPRSLSDPHGTHEANITGTLNVLMAARNRGEGRVVYASSSSVYGDTPTLPKVETMPHNPLSPYASHKVAGEHYGRIFNEQFGMQTIGLRYFNVFGPRQDPDSEYSAVIPIFIRLMLQGKTPTIYGDGTTSRDFTFVDDVVEANLLAALAPWSEDIATQPVFNVGAGGSFTLSELVETLNDLLGRELSPEYVDFRAGDIKHSFADIESARERLGFDPSVDFRDGLLRTIDYLTSCDT